MRTTSNGQKLITLAPAAPDAHDDAFDIFEDGASGLDDPSTVPASGRHSTCSPTIPMPTAMRSPSPISTMARRTARPPSRRRQVRDLHAVRGLQRHRQLRLLHHRQQRRHRFRDRERHDRGGRRRSRTSPTRSSAATRSTSSSSGSRRRRPTPTAPSSSTGSSSPGAARRDGRARAASIPAPSRDQLIQDFLVTLPLDTRHELPADHHRGRRRRPRTATRRAHSATIDIVNEFNSTTTAVEFTARRPEHLEHRRRSSRSWTTASSASIPANSTRPSAARCSAGISGHIQLGFQSTLDLRGRRDRRHLEL